MNIRTGLGFPKWLDYKAKFIYLNPVFREFGPEVYDGLLIAEKHGKEGAESVSGGCAS